MKLRRIIAILLLLGAIGVQAQKNDNDRRQQRGREQLVEYRHKFLTKDLGLSTDQQARFFALYDEMGERLEALNDEFRETSKKVESEGTKLSDVALEAYSRRLFDQKKLEGEIELEYYEKFKDILNPKQLARLKPAEMQILRNLSRFHRDRRMPPPEDR
ncbi:MAG: hypothetical protein K2G24_05990 [Muribaculaceae bacterium]|nr:hypothetical protein [Muribaculaceae bacterium]